MVAAAAAAAAAGRSIASTLSGLRASDSLTFTTISSLQLIDEDDAAAFANFQMVVTPEKDYDHYGQCAARVLPGLTTYVASLGPDNSPAEISAMARRITGVVRKVMHAFQATRASNTAAWVTLRVTTPVKSDLFRVPRWHTDGSYFRQHSRGRDVPPIKFLMSLRGPPTRLASISDRAARRKFNALERSRSTTHRRQLDTFIRRHADVIIESDSKRTYDITAVLLKVASPNQAAIHSEPLVRRGAGPRMFMSIVPGTPAQVKELCVRWTSP